MLRANNCTSVLDMSTIQTDSTLLCADLGFLDTWSVALAIARHCVDGTRAKVSKHVSVVGTLHHISATSCIVVEINVCDL